MATYKLTKEQKGKNYLYTVTDASGNVLSTRISKRDYVACTSNGQFYFGRIDLIGKGDHGRRLASANEFLANPEKAYKNWLAYFIPTERVRQKEELPFDKFVSERKPWYEKEKEDLNSIAYL